MPTTEEAKVPQPEDPPLSKRQLKKRQRLERLADLNKRRKLQEKEARRAKAIAEGRDLEAERRVVEENRKAGIGRQRREERWAAKEKLAGESFGVCVDCSYQDQLTAKEINSLALQLRYCYAANHRSPHPCRLAATSVEGATRAHLENVNGFEEWKKRAFDFSSDSLTEYYKDSPKEIVYLTSDSENILHDLDDSKIYVIGGIVDRNRLKRIAFDRAEKLGITTAKLPLEEHLRMSATKVLTVNHVFEILLKYRELGKDWKKALAAVLPQRKDASIKDGKTRSDENGDDASSKQEVAAQVGADD